VQTAVSSTRPKADACVRNAGKRCRPCTCKADAKALPAGDGSVRVSRQSKGRGGKTVTLVKGLALDPAALATLGKQLRTACGSGGTVKDGVLEIQGDHCELVMATLKKHGHDAKRAGG
jgi:translation initiation factor 1